MSEENKEGVTETEPQRKEAKNDETAKKLIYSLCYLWGILFFLPLILYKEDKDAVMHANEGLVLLLFSVAGNVIFGILSVFGWIFGMLSGVYSAVLLVLGIIGIVYVVTDKHEPLPLIGGIKLLK